MKPEEVVRVILNQSKDMTRPVFRGQAEESWELESGALRRLKKAYGADFPRNEDEQRKLVAQYHSEQLIMPMKVLGGPVSEQPDLQILAVLQHQGAATGLLDFTEYPLVALWFACAESPDKDGKVFVLDIADHEIVQNSRQFDGRFGTEHGVVYFEPDRSLGARIIAQQSVFVIGNPHLPDQVESIVVQGRSKMELREYLRGLGLSDLALFGDVPGLAAANTVRKELRVMEPLLPSQYRNRGNRAYQAGRFEEALAAYESYKTVMPNLAQPYCLIGDALAALGRFGEADKAYTSAMENLARPMDWIDGQGIIGGSLSLIMSRSLYYNRGNVRAARGNHEGAVEDFDMALQQGMEPKTSVLFNRGNSKFALELFEAAHEDFEAVWVEREDSGAALGMGNCKVMMGAFEEALQRYVDGSAVGPDGSAAHCQNNATQLGRLFQTLNGNDFRFNRVGHSVRVETEDLTGLFPLAGNKGNTGNIPSGMVTAPGGKGYKGADGFAVSIVSVQR